MPRLFILLFSFGFLFSNFLLSNNLAAFPLAKITKAPFSDISRMLKEVMPAVVSITVQGSVSVGSLFPPTQFIGQGSGVIIDADKGYILTNAHIIQGEQFAVTVKLSDEQIFKAQFIGSDPKSDIAVLRIQAPHLKAINLGNSDDLQIGEPVIAIGSPLGLSQTVTSGIVSSLQRALHDMTNDYEDFIQTDAAINPGNSGGALTNLRGELIGINSASLTSTQSRGNIGIGFAIPINRAKSIMQQLIQYGSVQRGSIGILCQDLTPALIHALQLPEKASGALISYVSPSLPADQAGLRPGDIIQTINDIVISKRGQVRNIVGMLRTGDRIEMQVLHNGKSSKISLTIADPKKRRLQSEKQNRFLFGMILREFHRTSVGQLGEIMGIQITDLEETSSAWFSGIRAGDIIISANQVPVRCVKELKTIAQKTQDELLLNITSPQEWSPKFVVIKP